MNYNYLITELKETANKINITYSAKEFQNTIYDININDKFLSDFFIINIKDSDKIRHKKATNQHALFKILENDHDFFMFFLNKVENEPFLDIFFNSTFSLNYPKILQKTLVLFPEKITTHIPFSIIKKMNSDYFITENDMNETQTFSHVLKKACINPSSVDEVFSILFEEHIYSTFNDNIKDTLNEIRQEFILLEKPNYHSLIFVSGWENETYLYNNIKMDAFSFYLNKSLNKKSTLQDAKKFKEQIRKNKTYIQERELSLLEEIINHNDFNYQYILFEDLDIFPLTTQTQLNNMKAPLLSHLKHFQVSRLNDIEKLCSIFPFNNVIGDLPEQKIIFNTLVDINSRFNLFNIGKIKNNLSLTLKGIHDYIKTHDVIDIDENFRLMLDVVEQGVFQKGLTVDHCIKTYSIDFYNNIKDSNILKDVIWISNLKTEDVNYIENGLLSKKEKEILHAIIVEDQNNKTPQKIKKRL